MPAIGEYRDRVVVLTRSLAAGDGFNERVESWPDPSPGDGEYWAKIEQPDGGEEPATLRQGTSQTRLRFRGVATIEAVDRVRIKATGEVYAVVGVHRERSENGGWQTVADLDGTY